tara:strand:- start:5988 stop:6197 length:210 start_codon:yes stop_codon:yes gene_type:complete
MKYSITVPMPHGNSLKALGQSSVLTDMTLVINEGWATFIGEANTPEEFEQDLIDSVDGIPEGVKAVEVW